MANDRAAQRARVEQWLATNPHAPTAAIEMLLEDSRALESCERERARWEAVAVRYRPDPVVLPGKASDY